MSELMTVKVWGEMACFTRPEMKVERLSYNVMTPSAARGILEAIFWKPEFQWRVREIWVLNEIRHISFLRNEMNSRQSERSDASKGGHYYADDGKNRAQRHTLALRDVAYIIRAEQILAGHTLGPHQKYREQFLRRVKKGQYFHHPYLGCREFAANFGPVDGDERPIAVSDDLGMILFDIWYEQVSKGNITIYSHDGKNTKSVKAKANPVFFQARLEDGVLHVPQSLYDEGGRN